MRVQKRNLGLILAYGHIKYEEGVSDGEKGEQGDALHDAAEVLLALIEREVPL